MVRDLEKSVKFYSKLAGMSEVRRFTPNGRGEIVFMASDKAGSMLELIQFDNVPKVEVKGMTLSFYAGTKLEKVREKAILMGYATSEIVDMPPKSKYFTLFDPDGILVEFTE